MEKITRVMVTGGRAPVALNICKLLKNEDVKVYVAESVFFYICKNTKYKDLNIKIPKPRQDFEEFKNEVIKVVKKYEIDLIIPTCEETLYFSMIKEEVERETRAKVFTMKFNIIDILHNKEKFISYCSSINIKIPKTKVMEIPKIEGDKIVLKPIYSRFGSKVLILDKNEAKNKLQEIDNGYIAQEFIKGKQICTYAIVQNGNILCLCNYGTSFVVNDGTNILFKYEENYKVRDIVKKIVKDLNFTGQISFDFIESENGEIYPIECNPRTTSGIHLIDSDEKIINKIINNEEININKDKVYSIKILMIIEGLKSFKIFNKKYKDEMKKSKDVIYDSKDKRPYIDSIISCVYFFLLGLRTRRSVEEAMTYDIEYNG